MALHGLVGATVEETAHRAGHRTGRGHRRWPSKVPLVTAACTLACARCRFRTPVPCPRTPSRLCLHYSSDDRQGALFLPDVLTTHPVTPCCSRPPWEVVEGSPAGALESVIGRLTRRGDALRPSMPPNRLPPRARAASYVPSRPPCGHRDGDGPGRRSAPSRATSTLTSAKRSRVVADDHRPASASEVTGSCREVVLPPQSTVVPSTSTSYR